MAKNGSVFFTHKVTKMDRCFSIFGPVVFTYKVTKNGPVVFDFWAGGFLGFFSGPVVFWAGGPEILYLTLYATRRFRAFDFLDHTIHNIYFTIGRFSYQHFYGTGLGFQIKETVISTYKVVTSSCNVIN